MRNSKSASLSTEEAYELIEILKKKVEEEIYYFPNNSGRFEFEVISDDEKSFIVNVQRKGLNNGNCTYLGRLLNGTILMRLDVGKNIKHYDKKTNTTILGSHLHIYSKEYGTEAIPFDIDNKDLFDICFDFFEKFHIIDPPTIAKVNLLDNF